MTPPAPNTPVVRYEIAPRSIMLVLATLLGVWLFLQLRIIVLMLVVALVIAGTISPLVRWMERRGLKRVYALTVLFVGLVLTTSLLLFLIVPPLTDQINQLARDAPHFREELISMLQGGVTAPLARAIRHAGLAQTFAKIEAYLVHATPQAATAVGWAVTTLFLAFYLLADSARTQGALYGVVPRRYHMRLARILFNLETIVGGYMRGQIITSAMIGVFTFVLLLVFKVPNALSLALFAALTDIIPFIGGLLATAPAVLAALSRGLPVGIAVLAILFAYQEVENRILIPKIYGRVLRLSSLTVVLALLAGGILHGIIGALLALPIAAALQMMLVELKVDLPGDDSDDTSAQARDATTEATYATMSAGATASEAGRIATSLAHDNRLASRDGATGPG